MIKTKKIISGFVVGAILMFTVSVYADSFIGKTVDTTYPLFVNNVRCTVDAISIEGTSYIPVRTAGEMFGYDVNFTSDVILLTKQKSSNQQELFNQQTLQEIYEKTPNPVEPSKTETITLDEYNQLEVGMGYEDAVKIIGGPGRISDDHRLDKENIIIYSWYGAEGGSSSAWITFKDDKLKAKGQEGLE